MAPVRIALHPAVSSDAPEIKYVFRTLLRTAGYSWEFDWHRAGLSADVFYGPRLAGVDARVQIHACGLPFSVADQLEPESFRESGALPFLNFQHRSTEDVRRTQS